VPVTMKVPGPTPRNLLVHFSDGSLNFDTTLVAPLRANTHPPNALLVPLAVIAENAVCVPRVENAALLLSLASAGLSAISTSTSDAAAPKEARSLKLHCMWNPNPND